MNNKTGTIITLLLIIVLSITIPIYIPYLAERISYHETIGRVHAYQENLAAMQNGDGLSSLFHAVATAVVPSVVVVQVSEKVEYQPEPDMNDFLQWYFGNGGSPPNPQPRYYYKHGLGSGIIIDANNGYILTNWHVVNGADTVNVMLADGRNYDTQWVRTDNRTDLAIVKIEAPDLISAPLGNSNEVEIGDWVLAIGAPEGLPRTVTAGIISAKGRVTSDGKQSYLQTDAAINPGNSGGPLVNMHGQVIGINTAIVSSVGQNEGIGLVIPSNTARNVLKQLIEKGKVTRGFLGIEIKDVNDQIVKNLNLPRPEGALVVKVVAGSPAEKAGILPGDFIVNINETKISDSYGLLNTSAALETGHKAAVEFYRKSAKKTVEVQVGSMPEQNSDS
jgi:serine protease Do